MAVPHLPQIEIGENPLVESYLRHLSTIKSRYYDLSPEECTIFPILDPSFIDYEKEKRRGISKEILDVVRGLGNFKTVTASEGVTDFWKPNQLVVSYDSGDIVYEFQKDVGHVPVRLVLKGPSYPDGAPIVNQEAYNVSIDLVFETTNQSDSSFIETWKLYIKESTS